MGDQLYGYTPAEHEYSVAVPELCDGDSSLAIYVSAHGGGTVGEEYADNGWDYLVTVDGETMLEGSDIRSGGMPASHASVARTLASFLSAAGESLHSHEHYVRDEYGASEYAGDYTPEQAEWLAAEHERLGMFATETSE
jgi:hypothetical protein